MQRRLGAEVGEIDVALAVAPTTTTRSPAIAALAGLVPCAEDGIRHTSRCPRLAIVYARMASSPAYSPCDPAFGCNVTAAKPVMVSHRRGGGSASRSPRSGLRARTGGFGKTRPRDRHHLAVAFSFMVQEPSGIMRGSARRPCLPAASNSAASHARNDAGRTPIAPGRTCCAPAPPECLAPRCRSGAQHRGQPRQFAAVTVSSSAMPTRRRPSPQIESGRERRAHQRIRAAAFHHMVSKNASCRRRRPPRCAASASNRAPRLTRRAMRFSPSGPCHAA